MLRLAQSTAKLPFWRGSETLVEALAPLCERAAARALAILAGER